MALADDNQGDDEDKDSLMCAIAALAQCGRALTATYALHPATLWLRGLGSFGTSVLFFNVDSEPPDHLHALARAVRSVFAGVGGAHDRRPFAPHATVMKTSRIPRGSGGLSRGMEEALYASCAGLEVGPLRVDSLQLCSMARDAGCYYPVVASLCLEVGEVTVGRQWGARFGLWQQQ